MDLRTEWQIRPAEEQLANGLADALCCPAPIARLLVSRGIVSVPAAEQFFHPSLGDLHSPHQMLGLSAAVDRIERAVANLEPILIYGDYDVDGTTATVLLKTAIDRLAPAGVPSLVTWHIPHRIREGYGLRGGRLSEAVADGIRLVISVDTGIRAFAAAEEARSLGLDLIVTDHHLPDEASGIPEALAVINPAQTGCPYPFKELCGAAVAFKLAHALLLAHASRQPDAAAAHRHLEQRLLPSFLKIVAIATIADSVPLRGENRIIATLGLRELANPLQPGLRALMEVASLPLGRAPSASDVGFRLGPRINAAGRMDVADDVIELFLTRSPDRAKLLASKLNDLNEDRRATEREALQAIEAFLPSLLEASGDYPAECLVLDHPGWHRGVLGILASRVVERTGRPTLVLTHEGEEAHGSGRSLPGFHLLDCLTTAHHSHPADPPLPAGLLTRFGGHAHAVGLSLPLAHLPRLRDSMQRESRRLLNQQVLQPAQVCDGVLRPEDLTADLPGWLDRCGPFGNAHTEPVFLVAGLVLKAPVRFIQERHACLTLQSAPAAPPLQAVAWSRSQNWAAVLAKLDLSTGSRIDLACRVRAQDNDWFHGIELEVVALRPA